jgi:hypothetical protein
VSESSDFVTPRNGNGSPRARPWPDAFTDPIPSEGRLIRAVRRHHEHARHAVLLARIARDTGGQVDVAREASKARRFEFPNPVDMRGIPALGKGVGGTIRGTSPGANLEFGGEA